MLRRYHHIEDEVYNCRKCDKYIDNETARENEWRCPDCESRLIIEVDYSNAVQMLVRKHIDDVEKGDTVLLRDGTLHEVFQNADGPKGKRRLNLRGFGSMIYREDEYVNCLPSWNDLNP